MSEQIWLAFPDKFQDSPDKIVTNQMKNLQALLYLFFLTTLILSVMTSKIHTIITQYANDSTHVGYMFSYLLEIFHISF